MNKPYFLAIVGPTATGKSLLAIQISQRIKSVIISMDSLQIYKGLNIGTAKPSDEELKVVKHEMIDIVSPFENYSVSEYITKTKELILKYNSENTLPILTGGTALYLKSLISNYTFSNTSEDNEYREYLQSIAKDEQGKKALLEMLNKVDPESASKLHYNNTRRVIRALEIYKKNGVPMSEQKDFNEDIYDYCLIGLNKDRKHLYEDINNRVDTMIDNGLLSEVKGLLDNGLNQNNQAMQGIGYKELIDYFNGNISLNESIDKIKQNSRRYAKRQITFFNSFKSINWLYTDKIDDILSEALQIINNSNIKDKIYYDK